MVMRDKEHSGAWRCPEFDCDGYSEYSPDCNGIVGVHSKLCHTCGYGTSCKHCMNVNDCKEEAANIKKQEEKDNE